MTHSFNIHIAKKYGLEEAIMISNFQHWIHKNMANEKHFYEGRTWTYNSVKAYSSLYPYWTEKQVRRILYSLVSQGVLLKDSFNKNPYLRTTWYSFVDESMFLYGQNDLPKWANGDDQSGNSITDIKPNEKPNKKEVDFIGLNEAVQTWLEYKKERKQSYKNATSTQAMINNLYELSEGNLETANKIVQQSIANNYSGLFPLRSVTKNTSAAPRPAVPASQSPMANQDNHSNYADYVAWCEKNNISPQPDKYANDSYLF